MKIDVVDIESIKPYPDNPRLITEEAVLLVAHSLKKYGWKQPIVVDSENVVVVGHTRLEAAITLGMTTVPVHVADDLSEDEIRAYRIADNKTSELTDWDDARLTAEIESLLEADMSLADMGFDEAALAELVAQSFAPNTDPDLNLAGAVTAEQLAAAQESLDGKHGSTEQKLVDVICPHCGEEFSLDPKSLEG